MVKDAIQRTLDPVDLAMVEEQEPLFVFGRGVNAEPRSHTENLYET